MPRADLQHPYLADASCPAFDAAARRTGMPARAVLSEPPASRDGRQRYSIDAERLKSRRLPSNGAQAMISKLRQNTFPIPAMLANLGVPLALMVLFSTGAHAFTAPAAGDLGYDIYDIVVNKGVKGPLGFVGGVAAFLFGVSRLFSNVMVGIPTIVAAVCLIKSDTILQTFGMVI